MELFPHTWSTVARLVVYIFVFSPSKQIFNKFQRWIKLLRGISGTQKTSGERLVEWRQILWQLPLRPTLALEHVAETALHVGGGFVDAEEFIWKMENVFLHHVDWDSVTFIKTKTGTFNPNQTQRVDPIGNLVSIKINKCPTICALCLVEFSGVYFVFHKPTAEATQLRQILYT